MSSNTIHKDSTSLQELFSQRIRPSRDASQARLDSDSAPNLPPHQRLLSALTPIKPQSHIQTNTENPSTTPSQTQTLYDSIQHIRDSFTPSQELRAAMETKAYIKDGFSDVDSFKAMAKRLQAEGVLNRDDMLAVDFLSKKSPSMSLRDFDAMIKSDNLSREMHSLIAQLVQKLHMLNYISGGVVNT